MKNIRILRPGDDLLEAVMEGFASERDGTENHLIVFPGRRPSHFVRKRLAEKRKSAFLAPTILAYDEFIEFLAARLGENRTNLDPLDAASLLFDIHQSSEESIGRGYFSSFDSFLPLGFKLYEELEELLLADAGERKVKEEIGRVSFGQRHVLGSYFREFYRTIGERGLLTRSTKLKLVADRFDSIDLSEFREIVLAGFYSLTPVDRKIFNGLLSVERSRFLFQQGPGLSRQLQQFGIDSADDDGADSGRSTSRPPRGSKDQFDLFTRPEHEHTGRSHGASPTVHVYRSPDLHGQVFAVTDLVRSLLSAQEPVDERTVIVLPTSEGLFPVVQHILPLLPPDGYNISLGYPLSRTPFYAFLSALLDLAATERDGSLQTASYLRFVLHPYVKNILYGKRSDVTRILFHTIEETLAARPSTTVGLEELEGDQKILERVALAFSREETPVSRSNLRDHLKGLHDVLLRPFLGVRTLRDFGDKTIALVQYINDRSTASQHPLFLGAARRFVEVADSIRRSLAADQEFSGAASTAVFFRSLMGPLTVPFPGTPLRGLQVLGLLETRNLSFDRVIVLDATDANIPGRAGTEALIPQNVREKLGLETARDRERLIEYYLDVLIAGAKEVHLFFTENKKEEKSRFIEKLLWREERQMADPRGPERSILPVRYRIHLVNPPTGSVAKSAETVEHLKTLELSATAIDQYLKCPLRFYHRYVLGLKEREEAGEEVEQYDIGNIVHGILNTFFHPTVGRTLTQKDLDPRRMEEVTEAAFTKALGPNLQGGSLLLKQQTATRLGEFLNDYQQQVITGQDVTILGVEETISVVKDNHHFSGRIDRVERRGDRIYILDYKIRQDDTPYKIRWKKFDSTIPETWPESIGSVQLPMYQLLYSESRGVPPESIVPAYVFLGRNQIAKDIETGLTKDGSVDPDKLSNLRNVILALADEIKDPGTEFTPTGDQKKECPRCPYQVMCGTQWAREGRW